MKLFKKLFPNKSTKERKAIEVIVSENHLQVNAPNQSATSLPWSAIKEIRAIVEKDEDGDPFMVISVKTEDDEAIIPRGCHGYKVFKNRIIKLADFATSNYNQALECDDTQQFILWRRKLKHNSPEKTLNSQKTA